MRSDFSETRVQRYSLSNGIKTNPRLVANTASSSPLKCIFKYPHELTASYEGVSIK